MPYVAPDSQYVVYEGDLPVGVGSLSELSAKLGLTERQIRRATSPSHITRVLNSADSRQLIAVRVPMKELA